MPVRWRVLLGDVLSKPAVSVLVVLFMLCKVAPLLSTHRYNIDDPSHTPWTLSDFLLPADHPRVVKELTRRVDQKLRAKSKPKPNANAVDARWKTDLITAAASRPLSLPCALGASNQMDEATFDLNPWYSTLSDRQQGNLIAMKSKVVAPPGVEKTMDLSQSLARLHASDEDCSNCILPNSELWLLSRARLAIPEEKASLQGVFLSDEDIARLEDKVSNVGGLVSDLAGNSFHGTAGN